MKRSLMSGLSSPYWIDGAVLLAPLPLRSLVMGIPGDDGAGDKGDVVFNGDGVGFESDRSLPTLSGTPLSRDDRRACFCPD